MDKEERLRLIKAYVDKVEESGTVHSIYSPELLEEFLNYIPPRKKMTEEKELIAFLEKEGYIAIRHIPGRGLCGLHRLLFTVGIVYGLDEYGRKGRYCYENWYEAVTAYASWDGEGDPPGNWIVNKGERGGDRQNPNRVKHEDPT